MERVFDMDLLREEYDTVANAERLIESDEEYTFGDFRDDAQDFTALNVLSEAVKVDNENKELYVREDAFDYSVELESARRGHASRPGKLEMGVLAGAVTGTLGSGWKLLEEGGPEYLVTGGLSVLAGRSALRRLGSIHSARVANDKAGERLDMSSYLEDYELKTVSDDEAQQILEQQRENERGSVKAYTADELEEMDMDELEQDIDGMFEGDR